jgi:hypothetical protein
MPGFFFAVRLGGMFRRRLSAEPAAPVIGDGVRRAPAR